MSGFPYSHRTVAEVDGLDTALVERMAEAAWPEVAAARSGLNWREAAPLHRSQMLAAMTQALAAIRSHDTAVKAAYEAECG